MSVHPSYRGLSYAVRSAVDSDRDEDVLILSGTGAPSGGTLLNGQDMATDQCAVYFRQDGAAATTIYVTPDGGSNWTAISSGTVATIGDGGTLPFGAGNDVVYTHDGATGVYVALTANDTTAYRWQDSTGTIATIDTTTGDIAVIFEDNIDVEIGTGSDLSIVHNGTDTVATSKTGDLVFDNTNATGSTIVRLGTDTPATAFEVRNNSDAIIFSVTADGTVDLDIAASDLLLKANEANAWTIEDSTGTLLNFDTTTGDLALQLPDDVDLEFGTGNDVSMRWDGTDFDVLAAADDSVWKWGNGTNSFDMWWYGDTANDNIIFDASAKTLAFDGIDIHIEDDDVIVWGDGDDITATFTSPNLVFATAVADTGAVAFGVDNAGIDVILYGDTAGSNITWDQSADSLLITDSTPLSFGDGGDVLVQFDATNLAITTAVADTGAVAFGSDNLGVDVILYGDTASVNATWDQSADSLIFTDNAYLRIGTGNDLSLYHDATDSFLVNTTGDLVIDNQDVDDPIVLRQGSDTEATSVDIRNNSDAALFQVFGSGRIEQTVTTVDMGAVEHTMVTGTAGANQTTIGGQIWFVDPNGGAATLVLPAEADYIGLAMVVNTADAAEAITIQDDAKGYTVIVLDQNQSGLIACDGTTWYGFMGAET